MRGGVWDGLWWRQARHDYLESNDWSPDAQLALQEYERPWAQTYSDENLQASLNHTETQFQLDREKGITYHTMCTHWEEEMLKNTQNLAALNLGEDAPVGTGSCSAALAVDYGGTDPAPSAAASSSGGTHAASSSGAAASSSSGTHADGPTAKNAPPVAKRAPPCLPPAAKKAAPCVRPATVGLPLTLLPAKSQHGDICSPITPDSEEDRAKNLATGSNVTKVELEAEVDDEAVKKANATPWKDPKEGTHKRPMDIEKRAGYNREDF